MKKHGIIDYQTFVIRYYFYLCLRIGNLYVRTLRELLEKIFG